MDNSQPAIIGRSRILVRGDQGVTARQELPQGVLQPSWRGKGAEGGEVWGGATENLGNFPKFCIDFSSKN